MPIRFADYTLDADSYRLERAGEPVTLRPKVFDLLVYLVRYRERVVRREELVKALWDDVAVGDGALSGLVNELRQALGEQGRGPSSIRTVHARGYQFVTPVETTHAGTEQEDPPFESAKGTDAIGCLIESVAEKGTAGVVIELAESSQAPTAGQSPAIDGRSRVLAALLRRAERTGFEVHRLVAPDESQVSASRLARQVIDSMIDRRGWAVVRAALPLPARRWLEDEVMDCVAGGLSRAVGGPPDPLGAAAKLLRALACRRPLVMLVEDADGAGGRFAGDLLRLKSALSRAPVLWVTPIAGSGAPLAGFGRRAREAGFEHWIETPLRAAVLDQSLGRLGLEPLPEPLFEALAAHLRGEQAGLSTIAEWLALEESRPFAGACEAPVAETMPVGARPETVPEHRMRRVEPATRGSGLRSIRS